MSENWNLLKFFVGSITAFKMCVDYNIAVTLQLLDVSD